MPENEIQPCDPNSPGSGATMGSPCTPAVCPFREGPETIDLLLAEMGAHDTRLLDAALDLRSLMASGTDAAACLQHLCELRRRLDGRHYLAFYRVRCWIRRHLRAEVRSHRGADWLPVVLPYDCGEPDAVINACLAVLADVAGGWSHAARVRFRFATETELADLSRAE